MRPGAIGGEDVAALVQPLCLRAADEGNHQCAIDLLALAKADQRPVAREHESVGVVDEQRPIVIVPQIVADDGVSVGAVGSGLD